MEVAQESLNEVNTDAELLKSVITGDEIRVYGYDVETNAKSTQWRHSGSPRPKKLDKFDQIWRQCSLYSLILTECHLHDVVRRKYAAL